MTKRVLFIVTELGRGGAETQLSRVAVELARRGWDAELISLMPPVGYVPELRAHGVPVHHLGLSRGRPTPQALVRALSIARSFKPAVICTFLFHATVLGTLLRVVCPTTPLVASIRDPSFGSPTRLRLSSWFLKAGLIQVLVANSEGVARQLRSCNLFPPKQVEFVPNGIDLDAVSYRGAPLRIRSSLGIRPADFLWLHVGNFQPAKDHTTLLTAFERVASRRDDVRLLMVGLGSPPAEVQRLLERASPQAVHLGERDDVLELMAAADGLVVSSSSEGYPNVLIEAFAASTPIVATHVGGIPELVEHGTSGILCPPSKPERLAEAMEKLMGCSLEERARMGAAGRLRVELRHSLSRVVDEWEALFERYIRQFDS